MGSIDPPAGGGKNPRNRRRVNDIWSQPSDSPIGVYLVAERIDSEKKFASINPVLAKIFLDSKLGTEYSARRPMINGNVMIVAQNEKKAKAAVGEHTFSNYKVKLSLHQSLNTSKGTIISQYLDEMTDEQLLKEMKDQKVTQVESFPVYKDGKATDAKRYKLTFDSPVHPERVKIGYTVLRVLTYYDNPLRCTMCQKYRHTKNHCPTKHEICRKCTQLLPHIECGPDKCVNCDGPHPSNHYSCPIRKEEMAIKRIQVDRRISAAAARREFEKARQNSSYANVVAEGIIGNENGRRGITHRYIDGQPDGNTQLLEQLKVLTEAVNKMQQQIDTLNNTVRSRDEEIANLKTELSKLKSAEDISSESDISMDSQETETKSIKKKSDKVQPSSIQSGTGFTVVTVAGKRSSDSQTVDTLNDKCVQITNKNVNQLDKDVYESFLEARKLAKPGSLFFADPKTRRAFSLTKKETDQQILFCKKLKVDLQLSTTDS